MLKEYKFCPLCTEPLESKTVGGAERRQCTGKACVFVFWNSDEYKQIKPKREGTGIYDVGIFGGAE